MFRFTTGRTLMMRAPSRGGSSIAARKPNLGNSNDWSKLVALSALERIGEEAIQVSGGVKFVGRECQVVISENTVNNVLGTDVETLLQCRHLLSDRCEVQKTEHKSVSMSIPLDHCQVTAEQLLHRNLGLLSLISSTSKPVNRMNNKNPHAASPMRMMGAFDDDVTNTPFEAPRLPVP